MEDTATVETNFDDFFGAFDSEGSNQTAAEETTETTQVEETAPTEETDDDSAESQEDGTATGETTHETENDGSDDSGDGGEPAQQEEMFTLKVNKEERQVGLEEMTTLAQKGADYDRVKDQLAESRQTVQDLQNRLDGQQEVMDILTQVAEGTGKPLMELAKGLFINFRKNAGVSEDAAALELEVAALKKQNEAVKPKEEPGKAEDAAKDRAKRELSEFRQLHPGVQLTDELVAKLKPDIRNGMSMANAYQKMLNEQKAAELAAQEQKLKAKKQNEENQRRSPGSQRDSGSRQGKSSYDDFFSQFK